MTQSTIATGSKCREPAARQDIDNLGFSEMNNWIPSNYANAYTLSLWQEVAALLIIDGQAGYFHDVQHFFPQAAALT